MTYISNNSCFPNRTDLNEKSIEIFMQFVGVLDRV